jgi:hypothetical protein
MTIAAPATDIVESYEALRAHALGTSRTSSPRGLAVLLRRGLPAFMYACAPTSQPVPKVLAGHARDEPNLGSELVALLSEMVLSVEKGCRV